LEATREAISHPEEFGPAFLQGAADPHVTGAAAGDLALLAATANPEATAEAIGGTASGAARGVGGAIKNIGGGIAAGGEKLANAKIGGFGVPGAGILDAILQRNPWGLVAAATPYAVKGAGKLIEGAGGLLESAPTRLSDALKGITSSVSDAAGSMFEQPVTKPAGWTPRSVDITPEAYSAAKQGTIVPEAAPAAAAPSIRGLAAAPEAPTPGSMNAAPEPKQLGGITADDIAGYRQMVESGYHPDNAARLTVGNDPLAQETLKQQAYGVSDSGPLSPWAMQPRATFTNTPAGTAGPGAFAPGARPTASLDALTPEGPAFSLKDYTVAGEPAPTGRSGLQLQDSWKNYGGPSVAAKTQETLGDAVSRIGAKQTGAPPEVKVTAKPGEGAASDWTSQGGVDFYKGVPVSRTVNQEALDSIDRIRAGGTPSRLDAAVTGIKSPNLEAVYKGDEIAPHRTGDISVHRTLNDLRDQLKTATASGDTQAIDQLNRAVRQQQMLRRKATGKK
jgi:hypothetical protein